MTDLSERERRHRLWFAKMGAAEWAPDGMDCARFVASYVEAITGVDHAAPWRGYETVEDGQAALRAAGYDDHIALVASILPEIKPDDAVAGDVAVTAEGALCIVQGRLLIGAGDVRMVRLPRREMQRAFRVE